MKKHFAIACLLLMSASANALIITIDPDDYAAGTNLSNLGTGVTLSTITGGAGATTPTLSSVYAQRSPQCLSDPTTCDATTGVQGFGTTADAESNLYFDWSTVNDAAACFRQYSLGAACDLFLESFQAMLIAFDSPTDYVQLSGAFLTDAMDLIAFDSAFNRITCVLPDCVSTHTFDFRESAGYQYNTTTVSLSTSGQSIAYVVAAGVAGNSSLDRLLFNVADASNVPEPGTLALFGAALAGLGLRRRRGV